ncbi:MAG: tetratricopeptide repeat protein [Pseudomonadota bacterium]
MAEIMRSSIGSPSPFRAAARKAVALGIVVLSAGVPGYAAAQVSDYEACLKLAETDPATAREAAARWEAIGGGAPSRHCGAVALMGLGANKQAAEILTGIGTEPGALSASDRAAALQLAGQLWLEEGQTNLAQQTFYAAYTLVPTDPTPLIGAARAAAAAGSFDVAEKHLSNANALKPSDPQVLTLRASARRSQNRLQEALADATLATDLAPNVALSWFERGAAERALGMQIAARESWLQASQLDPTGAAGDLARLNLQRMVLEE